MFRPMRRGQGTPPSARRVRIHSQAAPPASAATEPVNRLRRVRRPISLTARPRLARDRVGDDFVAGDHGAEIVPAGAGDLRDVDDEESAITDGEKEMLPARGLVAAEEGDQPSELDGSPDGEAGEERTAPIRMMLV